jgi:hypothetical protein
LAAKFPAFGGQNPYSGKKIACSSRRANDAKNPYLTATCGPFASKNGLHQRIFPAEIPVLGNLE